MQLNEVLYEARLTVLLLHLSLCLPGAALLYSLLSPSPRGPLVVSLLFMRMFDLEMTVGMTEAEFIIGSISFTPL